MFNRIVPQWLFRCRRFVIYELTARDVVSTAPSEATEVKWCETDEEFATLSKLTFVASDSIPVNAKGIIASIDQNAAGGIWVCEGQPFPEVELGIDIDLAVDQAWLFGARVDSTFRGRGVYNCILDFATRNLAENGKQKVIVAVNPDNRASNHVHKRWSKRTVGKVFAARLFRFTVCRSSGNAKCDRMFSTNCDRSPIHVTANCT